MSSNTLPVSKTDATQKPYLDLLRTVPAFRDLWIGQAISQLGDSLYYLVFLFMIEKITHDPATVGAAGVAQTLPFLLLSPYAGVLADRLDRRTILLWCDLASAIALLLFAGYVIWDATPPVWTLIAAGASLSAINTFFAPAKGAAIPQLVPENKRDTANALSLATQNLLPMLGIALSGTVLALLYAVSPTYFFVAAIVLNGLSFLGSAAFIVRLPCLVPEVPEPMAAQSTAENTAPPVQDGGWQHALRDVRDGFVYLRGQRVLWVLLWLNLLTQIALGPFMLVYIEVNNKWFGGGYGTLAFCEVSFFAGVVACSAVFGRFKVARPGMAFIVGVALIGITIVMMGVSKNVAMFAAWNVVCGLVFPFIQLPMAAYIQKLVPQHYQGRVNAAMTMTGMGVAPLSIGLGGLLLAAFGPAKMLYMMGAGMSVAGLMGLADRAFRTVRTDDDTVAI